MNDRDGYVYPDCVRYQIAEKEKTDYQFAADFINQNGYDVLSIQHEYGIFGGVAGSYILNLAREAKMPIVTTLHTVLQHPSAAQKVVLDELLQLSERVIVMSHKAVEFLVTVHGMSEDKIDLIPHGIPKVSSSASKPFRRILKIPGPIILTFGLLSPDKGIQYVIEAMPEIVQELPGATYVVVGATHPNIRASAGEKYRESLVKLADDLGVSSNVRFVDRFVKSSELINYLGAMDIYVTPYLNPKQITSGTLAYAVGAGKAVISTPYWYAQELLAEGRGVLVPFKDSDSISDAVVSLQNDPDARIEMGQKAAAYGRLMLWPEVGASYLNSFTQAREESKDRLRVLFYKPMTEIRAAMTVPETRLTHLFDLSDDTGILQHASFTVPNRHEGYCVDDNARALLLTALMEGQEPLTPDVALVQSRYLSFLLHAFNPQNGRFRNFMNYGRDWLEDMGSEDSHGRSLWGLGSMVHHCRDRGRRDVAKQLFEESATTLFRTRSLRTWAYGILALNEYLFSYPDEPRMQALLETMASRIWSQFEFHQCETWPWFEQTITYANARLPQALLLAGDMLGNMAMLNAGLDSLSWLMKVQTDTNGFFAPIGSDGFYENGGERSLFDQQPVEATASISACLCAFRITGQSFWLQEVRRAFRWFHGDNMLGQPLYDPVSGGCHDGLHPDRVNRNQGAESTLSYLCSSIELTGAFAKSGLLKSNS